MDAWEECNIHHNATLSIDILIIQIYAKSGGTQVRTCVPGDDTQILAVS